MTVAGHAEMATIRTVLDAHRDALKPAVEAFGAARTRARDAADIHGAITALADASLAAETLAKVAKEADAKLGDCLLEMMDGTGDHPFSTANGVWSLASNPVKAIITDEKDLPPQFWRTPAAVVDKAAVLAHMKAGQHVPGAVLSNAGQMHVVFHARKG